MSNTQILDRKYILDFIDNFPKTNFWKLSKLEQLQTLNDALEKILEYISSLNASTSSFEFSARQKFILEQLIMPNAELENGLMQDLNNTPRFTRFIGDCYYNFWDYFYDYGTRKNDPINQVEKNTIIPIIQEYIATCKKILNSQ